MAKSKETVETAGFKPNEGEEGYVHVQVTQVPGETLPEPKVMAFHPNVYEQSISKTPGFVGDVIYAPKGFEKKFPVVAKNSNSASLASVVTAGPPQEDFEKAVAAEVEKRLYEAEQKALAANKPADTGQAGQV